MNVKVTPQMRAALVAIAAKWNDESVIDGPPFRASTVAQTALEVGVWDMAVRHLGPERARDLRHAKPGRRVSDDA